MHEKGERGRKDAFGGGQVRAEGPAWNVSVNLFVIVVVVVVTLLCFVLITELFSAVRLV